MGSELYRSIQKMWELSQIRILQTNFKIGILHTFRKFFFSHLLTLNFMQSNQIEIIFEHVQK
ncbi:hypothetical protein LIH_03445 [Leptospira interrogans serovar Hardjo-prajitno]|uniref:Uncharacterized protein n=1 Tax=Leptospira interrogans serovar Hardjo str. Norma TaxID=1279460 RepID=A0A0M5L725_LEPIR|nr:hypothetical protein G436_0671 [Leptospira interrogans serovar Hardjo str. Norma]ALN99409.1 hypothetical protein LIH_03445 [Leptospira interrogans serovar Hardjo-prajitno]KWV22408.1 hypothetical protein LA733_3300 [Leptospira interrogans]KWV22904.1 hypothetical protein LA702_3449 [Leptospira interrogans]